VLLGWAAGLLILLALPWFEPLIARAEVRIFDLRDRLRERRAASGQLQPAPVEVPALLKPRPVGADEEVAACEAASTARPPRAPLHLAPGPHTARAERTPITPAGGRRPAHQDRVARGAAPAARPLTGG
jgi:hypothetical protein